MREGDVLVIDDDEDLGIVIEEVLGTEGYRVRRATSMRDGLLAVDDEEPSLVLLDWCLPDGDPDELARLLRDRGVPVVLTSGDDRAQERGVEIGAVAVLGKPFDLDELLEVLQRHVRAGDERHVSP
ncbi:MAG TPA: response regulator [Polyangia bacterium]|nr:response regulator [Polyangia bacterium]